MTSAILTAGPLQILSDYVRRIWEYRHFWFSLVKIDISTRYRRSLLGLGWSLINPIAMTIVICVVFQTIIGMPNFNEAAPQILSGLAFWAFISQCMQQGCNVFIVNQRYIMQEPAPLAIYPLRTVLAVGFHFAVSILIALVMAWAINRKFSLEGLAGMIPAALLLLALGWALATLSGFAHTYFPDTSHLLEVGLQILFYLTPIIYSAKFLEEKGLGYIVHWNPMAWMVALLRAPVVQGAFPDLMTLGIASAIVGTVSLAAMAVIRRQERELVFHF
jgi:ABC-type polysaccharide/polyol phosphate export permease